MAGKLSPEMMKKIRSQRKLQRKQVAGDIAAGIGASAETFRTGASAPEVFEKWRPDYSGQIMTKAEKMEQMEDIYKEMEKSERHYFGKALETAKNRARIQEGNARRKLQENKDAARRQDMALYRRQKALNDSYKAQGRQVNLEIKRLESPSPGVKAQFKDMDSWSERRQDVRDQQYKMLTQEDKDKVIAAYGSEKAFKKAMLENPEAQQRVDRDAKAQAREDAVRRIEALASGDVQDKDLLWAIKDTALRSGLSIEEVYEGLDSNTKAKASSAEKNVADSMEKLNAENRKIFGGYEKETISLAEAHGTPDVPGAYVGIEEREKFAPGLLEKTARGIGATRVKPVEEVDPTAVLPTAEDFISPDDLYQQQIEKAKEGIGEAVQPTEDNWLGIAGAKAPVGGAQAHFRGLLDVIENYPEEPPAQYAKSQIMKSQEFQDYSLRHFGEEGGDSDIAWKEMVRDWRKQNREENRAIRDKRRTKRLAEKSKLLDDVTNRPLREPNKASKVVAGAASSAAEDSAP